MNIKEAIARAIYPIVADRSKTEAIADAYRQGCYSGTLERILHKRSRHLLEPSSVSDYLALEYQRRALDLMHSESYRQRIADREEDRERKRRDDEYLYVMLRMYPNIAKRMRERGRSRIFTERGAPPLHYASVISMREWKNRQTSEQET